VGAARRPPPGGVGAQNAPGLGGPPPPPPPGVLQTPVSIADLGGTEIDLRFGGPEGQLQVVVAPVLRFADIGFNADVRIEQLGDPDKIM